MQAILWEIVINGALVLAASMVLHYLAFKKGILEEPEPLFGERQGSDATPEYEESEDNPFIKKWLAFGGGYYGTIAFVKLILIEVEQARDLATNWQGFESMATGSVLNTIIRLAVAVFVEQFQNFAQAISWPAYYVSHYPIGQCAIFVVTTYLIFVGARHAAWHQYACRLQQ